MALFPAFLGFPHPVIILLFAYFCDAILIPILSTDSSFSSSFVPCRSYNHTGIWTLWSYICLLCTFFFRYSSLITVPYIWHKLHGQIIYIFGWTSGCILFRSSLVFSCCIFGNFMLIGSFIFRFSAAFIILEAISCTWPMWYICWFLIPHQYVQHSKV